MEKDWVDFRLVKQRVSMQMVLNHYHINGLRKTGDELRGACPIHKGEGTRTFQVNVNKNAFQCFSCKAHGNVLDFVASLESCTVREAALKLQSWFLAGESGSYPERASQKMEDTTGEGKPAEDINPPLTFQLRVDAEHEYGVSRGVRRETLQYFAAGLCLSKGTFSGRFVIPLHNEQGELVGYAGRSIDNREPKYLFPSAENGFYKRYLLFNLHRLIADPSRSDVVVVVEGFFGCFKVTEAGYRSVSLLGSSLTAEQEELIVRHFKRAVLLFDGDGAGHAATDTGLQRLGRRMWVNAISLPDQVQPDQLSGDSIKQLLNRVL